ncbi:hypothetical protein JOC54_000314 [Alkalihalobacillus xiaoxiensis]|uniref:Uncharacterized protein n=1 Tax=Shouchella xiaoxiensis TaxID=766895 RepID=A0ABS2SNI8_9BACI|nr:hypothetical protein [Shouchella xiaoxiensis]MBM7837083.1 hypothetical protein [Shouchella xiaoxiensis]
MILKSIGMYDKELRIKDPLKNLNFITRCITDLFEECLGTFKTNNCRQLNFILGEYSHSRIDEENNGFYEVEVPFNKEVFLELSEVEQKKILAKTLIESMLFVSELKNWDSFMIKQAYLKMKERNFKNEFYVFKNKRNMDQSLLASVFCEYELYAFFIWIEIRKNDKNKTLIKRELIHKTLPIEYEFSRLMKELKWINNNEIALYIDSHKENYQSIIIR